MDIIFWSSLPNNYGLIQRYIGPYQLGHWLEKHGHTYQVIDFIVCGPKKTMSSEDLLQHTEKFITSDTKAIGFSTTFFQSFYFGDLPENIKTVLLTIKEKYPHIKFIMGGNKAENSSPEITALFDAIVIGLGEDVTLELMDFYKGLGPEPKSRRNILHKTKFYYADDVVTKKFDIRTCDHVWAEKDIILPNEVLPLEISRGCIFKCTFCQYPLLGRSKYDYTRGMEFVKQELILNYEKWGTTNYYILDDTFNDTVQKMKEFSDMVASLPFKIRFACYLRADLLNRFPETIMLLKNAGLAGAHFGIETFGEEASKTIGKGWSSSKAKDFLPWLIHEAWNDEVAIHCSMIGGLPGDTEQSLIESANWLNKNKIPSWNFKPLGVYKYSDQVFSSTFAKEAVKYGFEHHTCDPWEWVNIKTGLTFKKTKQLVAKVNKTKDRAFLRYDSWASVALVTFGYKLEDVRSVARSRVSKKTLLRKRFYWVWLYNRMLKLYPDTPRKGRGLEILASQEKLFTDRPYVEDDNFSDEFL